MSEASPLLDKASIQQLPPFENLTHQNILVIENIEQCKNIENELKAELLTGRELNLENARMAALKGDQASVAKELASQAMDFNAFSELNVVKQKALAEKLAGDIQMN